MTLAPIIHGIVERAGKQPMYQTKPIRTETVTFDALT
jgi:hypothetical protein